MKGVIVVLALGVGALVAGARVGHADGPANCGLPATGPMWVDYAGHDAPITPKPGLVLAVSSGTVVPAAMRAAGAATIRSEEHTSELQSQ